MKMILEIQKSIDSHPPLSLRFTCCKNQSRTSNQLCTALLYRYMLESGKIFRNNLKIKYCLGYPREPTLLELLMDTKWIILLVLNRIAVPSSYWAWRKYPALNRDFLFPDQITQLRKEIFVKRNNGIFQVIISIELNMDSKTFSRKTYRRHTWKSLTLRD